MSDDIPALDRLKRRPLCLAFDPMNLRFRQKTALCACAFLLALSMVGAEFMALAHQVTAHHVFCLAHGHMVDAGGHSSSSTQGARAAPIVQADVPLEAGHDHRHCDKTVFLQVGAFETPPGSPRIEAAAWRPPSTPTAVARPRRELLFLAPKHSPPARG